MLSVKNRVEMFKNEMLEENTKLKAELGELKKTTSSLKNDTEAMKDGDKKIQRKVSIGGKIQIICLILAIIAIILVFIV
jgi:regulator of replication initiation timing